MTGAVKQRGLDRRPKAIWDRDTAAAGDRYIDRPIQATVAASGASSDDDDAEAAHARAFAPRMMIRPASHPRTDGRDRIGPRHNKASGLHMPRADHPDWSGPFELSVKPLGKRSSRFDAASGPSSFNNVNSHSTHRTPRRHPYPNNTNRQRFRMPSLEALAEALSAAEGGAVSTAVLFPLEVRVWWIGDGAACACWTQSIGQLAGQAIKRSIE